MPDESVAQSLVRLRDLEAEYDVTIRVVAVLVERLQLVEGTTEILIPEAALVDNPSDLHAWRDAGSNRITLKTTR